jgi:hypothetical protein
MTTVPSRVRQVPIPDPAKCEIRRDFVRGLWVTECQVCEVRWETLEASQGMGEYAGHVLTCRRKGGK